MHLWLFQKWMKVSMAWQVIPTTQLGNKANHVAGLQNLDVLFLEVALAQHMAYKPFDMQVWELYRSHDGQQKDLGVHFAYSARLLCRLPMRHLVMFPGAVDLPIMPL